MELPDDVLQLVRAYAKPSEPYKMYTRVLNILGHGMPLDMYEDMTRKLKRATRLHYDRFHSVFLEFEKRHNELVIAIIDTFCKEDTTSEVRMDYYSKSRHYACNKRELIIQLNEL